MMMMMMGYQDSHIETAAKNRLNQQGCASDRDPYYNPEKTDTDRQDKTRQTDRQIVLVDKRQAVNQQLGRT